MRLFSYDTSLIRGTTFTRGIRYSTFLCQSSAQVTVQTGPAVFTVQTGMTVSVGQRVRASLEGPPLDDPTIFVEGVVTAYSGGTMTINVDVFSGVAGSSYNSWTLSAAYDLTGAALSGTMRFSPIKCASRERTPVALTVAVVGGPTFGVFTIYLSPTQTAGLTLGDYQYVVLIQPQASSDLLPVLTGHISVIDS